MSNYDPQKAHEYYEKHKQNKGRRSTKGMTQTQKEQWGFAKSQINEQYKDFNKSVTENAKEERAALVDAAKAKITALKKRLKNLPKDEREALQSQIASIRDNLTAGKQNITDSTKATKENAKAQKESDLDNAFNAIKG